jgi:UDP-glucose 4-epimerase
MRSGDSRIRIIDNLSVGTREDLAATCDFREVNAAQLSAESWVSGAPCELVVGDIGDLALASQVCAGADVVVHLAANAGVAQSVQDPHFDCVTNVLGTLNYLEASRRNKVRRFILASSGAAVGECEPPIDEEKVPHPASPYGASKSAAEGYCSAYYRTYGLETVCLRFGNVYGPGSTHKSSVVAKFIKQLLSGEVLEVYGDGTQSRDYIYVGDLLNAILSASTTERAAGEVFQIATNRETTVLELLEMLRETSKVHGLEAPTVSHAQPLKGEVQRNFSDTRKAARILGWKATTSLTEGLSKTFAWFISHTGRL